MFLAASGQQFLLAIAFIVAWSDTAAAVAVSSNESADLARITIPKVGRMPRLDDFTGTPPNGQLTTPMIKVDGFVQRAPDDGRPATERTEVYLAYDDSALYVAFVAHDSEPQKINARLNKRDVFGLDEDQLGIYIDTFFDRHRAYQFACNALGVQSESIFAEETGTWDDSFDTLWNSQAQFTDHGYVVLMAIPFKSLRFSRADVQHWGIAVWRWIPRKGEGSWWPRVSQSIRGFLSQEAVADGLQGISPGRNVQAIPYVNWRAFHAIDLARAQPAYVEERADVAGGLDTKMIIDDALVVDVTANPDFAQVESDEPQITVNRRFEVFFPEKRPFFTENANFFEAPMADDNRLLFTRRIADPDFGARVTGKMARLSVAALFADDRAAGERVDPDDPSDGVRGQRAWTNAVRVSHDLPRQASVGAMYVERRFAGTDNQVADIDTSFRLGDTWAATLLAANSWTRVSSGSMTSRSDLEARVNRQGRAFNYNLQFVNMAPDFEAQSGFILRTDNRYVLQDSSYTFWIHRGLMTQVKPGFQVQKGWFFHGGESYAAATSSISVELNHQTTLEVHAVQSYDVLRPQDYAALASNQNFPQTSFGTAGSSRELRWLRFDYRLDTGRRLHYIPPAGEAPRIAGFYRAQVAISIRPTRGLTIDNAYLFDRNVRPEDNRQMYSSHVLRSKWNWQLSRELSVRVIAQYDGLAADPRFTSANTGRSVNGDFLLTYLVHPGTALYIGYNTNFSRPPQIGSSPDEFVNDGHQFFVKASYLFRL